LAGQDRGAPWANFAGQAAGRRGSRDRFFGDLYEPAVSFLWRNYIVVAPSLSLLYDPASHLADAVLPNRTFP